MKVFTRIVHRNGKSVRALVAAKNQREAARLLSTTLYDVQKFYNITGNKADIALAMANQGTVVYKDAW